MNSVSDQYLLLLLVVIIEFNLRDELSEVQQLLDGSLPADQQVEAIHKKYMGLVSDISIMTS